MRIGYPCINTQIGCTANTTFRLASYSRERMRECITNNLTCLERILEFNLSNNLMFFRLSSAMVPFASHPVCDYKWETLHKAQFERVGRFVKKHKMRVSMHPDQFVLINSPTKSITEKSILELEYHAKVLDLMGLDSKAKMQIHVGGVYGDKELAIERFCGTYSTLPKSITRRLVIENDDRLYSLKDCLEVHDQTGIPILFDSFHHECLNNGEKVKVALAEAATTWKKQDGILMVDYSEQKKDAKAGSHTHHISIPTFTKFISETRPLDFDIMLEIKDKQESALPARDALLKLGLLK